MLDGGELAADIGKQAAKAYRDALEGESEALALRAADDSLTNPVRYLRETHAEDALTALGVRLSALLDDVKPLVADLKGASTAEGAITVGGKAPEAWRLLSSMVGTLRNIRDAQNDILRAQADEARWPELLKSGHGEVRGLNPDDAPERILESIRTRRYDVGYLIYLSGIEGAYVPSSYDELADELDDETRPALEDALAMVRRVVGNGCAVVVLVKTDTRLSHSDLVRLKWMRRIHIAGGRLVCVEERRREPMPLRALL